MSVSNGTVHVLHVDDEPSFSDVTVTYLEREDEQLTISTETSPEDGLETLEEEDIDCIVSDYDMPRTNGLEFLETVRDRYPDIPFILYTGKGSEEVASDAISMGVTDYLQKGSGAEQYAILANRIRNAVAQVRAEQEIDRTREYFGTILEHASDFVMIGSEEGTIKYVSPAVERVLGYSPDEIEGSDVFDFVSPGDRPTANNAFETVLERSDEEVTAEFRMCRDDGAWRWVEARCRNLLHDPVVEGVIINGRDITEQKASRHERETIIDNLPGYVYRHLHEQGWPLEFVKGSTEEITGYTAAELADEIELAEQIIHPDDEDKVWTGVEEGLESAGEFDLTYRIITKGGEMRWVRDQGQLVEGPATGQEYLDGFITDITDRRRQRKQLRESTSRLEVLFDNSPDMIVVLDSEGTLCEVNHRICAELGYDEDELLGTPIWDIDQSRTPAEVGDLLETFDVDERQRFEGQYERADGSTVPVEVHLLHINLDGQDRFLAISRDITERKEQEREREATIEFLQSCYDVATDTSLDSQEKITRLLELGPEKLGLPYGHLTRIKRTDEDSGEGSQRIIEASGDHDLLQPGDVCLLTESYCRKTIERDGLLEIRDAIEAGWEGDPAYQKFDLGCYIGETITVHGELYGTVFFASASSRSEPFTDAERTFVRLTAQLVQYELERTN